MGKVTIGGAEYELRRPTFRVLRDEQGASDDLADAQDRLDVLNARQEHTQRRLEALSAQEAYDREEEARILQDRTDLRRQANEAMGAVIDAQMRLLAGRIIDGPTPDELMDLVDPSDAGRILSGINEVDDAPLGQGPAAS